MATGGGDVKVSSKEGDIDNVRVAVRSRPLSQNEIDNRHSSIVTVDQTRGEITVILPNPKGMREPKKTFTFDSVFGPDTTQADVYNETARPIVNAVLEGYNGTIFAYGQTGTGKTYTMAGDEENPEKRGIIPNSFAHIFGHIAKCEGETKFLVRVSYLEIYNEEVRDLLNKKSQTKLKIRETPDTGVYVKDLSLFVVKNTEEMEKLMTIGNKNRAFGATDMNERSSRSHTIFSIIVEQSQIGPDKKAHVRVGKLHLVDLAGSERLSKTGATGVRKDEASNINKSLTNLGIVIAALVDGKSIHIPYRNSKLTRLLQDSLGGNSKTVMIANIGPADYNSDETLSTLRYANTAKRIQNKAKINEDPKDAMLRQFQKEIEKLKKMLEDEDEEEEEEEEGEEGESLDGKRKRKKKKNKKDALSSSLSPREMAELKKQIEQERKQLNSVKDVAEIEKTKMETELSKKEEELAKAQEEQAELQKKLSDLEAKVIVGGVNLLEQTEKQERLLEKSRRDLEKRKKKESLLKEQLKQKEDEQRGYEVKIANLQETTDVITHQLKDTWKQLQAMKDELIAEQEEYQREKEYLLQDIRELDREVELQTLIMDSYIPQEYQALIEQHVTWDEEEQEYHLDGVAYAGNSINHSLLSSPPPLTAAHPQVNTNTLSAYLSYTTERDLMMGGRAMGGVKTSRGKLDKNKGLSSRQSKQRSQPTMDQLPNKKVTEQEQYPSSRGLMSRQKHY